MTDIFDEIEEDLRADRLQALAKRYGGLAIAAALVIVAFVAGWQAWQWWQAKQRIATANQFIAAMQQADTVRPAGQNPDRAAAANAFLALTNSSADGYRTLARMRAAALKADLGDTQAALTLWDQVAADRAADPLLRDLATLLWAQHQIDGGDAAAIEARLKTLTAADNPWHGQAQETEALLDIRIGKTDAARALLKSLASDATASENVRGEASGLLTRLGG